MLTPNATWICSGCLRTDSLWLQAHAKLRLELRDLLRSGTTPFKDQPFDQVSQALGRWYVGQRLAQAVEAYYLNARARVVIAVVKKPR